MSRNLDKGSKIEPTISWVKSSLREKSMLQKKLILIVSDLLMFSISIITGWGITEFIKIQFFPDLQTIEWERAFELAPFIFGMPVVFIIISSGFRGHYAHFRPFWDEFSDLFKIIFIAAGLVIVYLYLTKSHFSRLWFINTWSLVVVLLPAGRLIAKKLMMRIGIWYTPTVVIGTGTNAVESAEAVESDPLLGMKVVALLDPNDRSYTPNAKYQQFYIGDNPDKTLNDFGGPFVVLALETQDYDRYAKLIDDLCSSQTNMIIVPSMRGLPLFGSELFHVFRHEVLMLRVRNNLARRSPVLLKRSFDLVIASFLLIMLSPLFVVFSWLISRDGSSAFYGHERVGRHGESFLCYKFRTMVSNSEERLKEILEKDEDARKDWERDFKLKKDPRVTKIGEFLRRTSLDELPQLWNVLKGEMSLVGPRPIVKEELVRYGDQLYLYLEVRPGMTGLWQISGRNDTGYEQRVSLDAWYTRNWSIWYDIVILLKTIPAVMKSKGAY